MILLEYANLLKVSASLFLAFYGSVVGALVIGVTVHEFSHCFTAYLLGDNTAKNMGRLTLNPKAHLEPLGLILMMTVGFGWGRPSPVNPYRLAFGPKRGGAITAFAGPLSNLVVAAAAGLPISIGLVTAHTPLVIWNVTPHWSGGDYLGLFLSTVVIFNIILALFNLLPLAPLDGFSVVLGIVPDDLAEAIAPLERYGIGILVLLIALPWMTGGQFGIFTILSPVLDRLTPIFTGISGGIPA